jgi:hypothetical protein
MCYFIHIGVPAAHAATIESPRVPRIEPHDNPSVAAAFGPSFALFGITDGGCACRLYSSPDGWSDRDRTDTRRRKYERMGWSEAKIARALAASGEAQAQSEREPGLSADVAKLVANIATTAGEVRLIVHDYRGSFAEERVVAGEPRSVGAGELIASQYAAIREDTVYVIR